MHWVGCLFDVKFVSNFYYCFVRLAQPEDIQFFQFDKDGNMFVYEPGAGCTGIPKKVAPGDDLISTWKTDRSSISVDSTQLSSTMNSIFSGESHCSNVDLNVMEPSKVKNTR